MQVHDFTQNVIKLERSSVFLVEEIFYVSKDLNIQDTPTNGQF